MAGNGQASEATRYRHMAPNIRHSHARRLRAQSRPFNAGIVDLKKRPLVEPVLPCPLMGIARYFATPRMHHTVVPLQVRRRVI